MRSAIPLASEGTAKRLYPAGYESAEVVAATSAKELQRVENIGPAVAEARRVRAHRPA